MLVFKFSREVSEFVQVDKEWRGDGFDESILSKTNPLVCC
jgi:hypothetical protein